MLEAFAEEVVSEFDSLGDCIWKMNEQIDEVKKVELAKLNAYFPNDAHSQALRWKYEGYNVNFFFPLALNYSFVVLVFIKVTTKLMRFCEILHDLRGSTFRAKELGGSGVEKYALYIERVAGVKRGDLCYWEQISALQRIRNCIVHTAGIINEVRDSDALRKILAYETYFAPHHRSIAGKSFETGFSHGPDVSLIQHQGAEKLMIRMHYPLVVNSYVRDFLLDLVAKLGGESNLASADQH